ncbi:MAG: DEAD/DEAH box helicase [Planctomycetes bacterium]|nr:DEAD/DEAH box helicase [Planctomycetota bacterium]
MTFSELGLAPAILRAVTAEGYTNPTPIQLQAIPHVAEGRDVLGCAQTGTGKTAAFALPILHRLLQSNRPAERRQKVRVLVLSPTRELASQIGLSFQTYGRHTGLRHAVIFGGVGQGPQVRALRDGLDVLVATPGRLLDLVNQGYADLSGVEVLVLDEADRMFDMGFLPDLRRLIALLPTKRQTLLFSATMPGPIEQLAVAILRDPVHVRVASVQKTTDLIDQSVCFVPKADKTNLLIRQLKEPGVTRAIVFTRTKNGADRVVRKLIGANLRAEAIHGNKSQNARQRALLAFKTNRIRVLVATDLAARGIDVDGVSHVINFDIPHEPETYVHRIGRTGRAGAEGVAIAYCDGEERSMLRAIEKLMRQQVRVNEDHPYHEAAQRQAPAASQGTPHQQHGKRPHGKPAFGKRPQSASRGQVNHSGGSGKRFHQKKKRTVISARG